MILDQQRSQLTKTSIRICACCKMPPNQDFYTVVFGLWKLAELWNHWKRFFACLYFLVVMFMALGTNNNYWLRDENGNAPALNVLQDSVKSVVDVTNEMAMQWYEQLLLNATAFLSADGVVVNGDSISKLPVHFTTKQPLSYPYQMVSYRRKSRIFSANRGGGGGGTFRSF